MAVSEHNDSKSPVRQQLHCGFSPPSPGIVCHGIKTWPSSPPNPARPLRTFPSAITPPPRPVPMIAETEVNRLFRPKIVECPHSAAALPSLRYVTGLPSAASKPPRRSKPFHCACTQLVAPRVLSTPVALAGPGVSSPTTAISAYDIPTFAA